MALSSLTFTASGRGPYAIHTLDYISTAHLTVTVNGSPAAATFNDATKTMTLTADPAAGATIVVTRTTPRLKEERLTNYLALPTGSAGLNARLLDQDHRQLLMVMGEGRDQAVGGALPAGAMGVNASGQWEGLSKRIENVTLASEPTDAAVKSQLDVVAASARPLPTAVLDPDDGLMVVGGEWDDQAPAGFRTALQLGSAALLNAGTAANEVPAFDSSSPPRYPTASGELVDLTQHALNTEIAKRALATVVRIRSNVRTLNINTDVTNPNWSQASNNRVSWGGTAWTGRTELNNGALDCNGNFTGTAARLDLTAGTWRLSWIWQVRQQAAVNFAFRLTNADDTGTQVVYVDYGVMHTKAAGTYFNLDRGEHVIASASPFSLCFRAAGPVSSAGTYELTMSLLAQKISTSVAS